MAAKQSVVIQEMSSKRLDDLGTLFGSQPVADRCWCMWFLIPVKQFHTNGREGNRSRFIEVMEGEPEPIGLIAYFDEMPVGWCAVGPRSRYARAVKTPTMKGRRGEDELVWLVPCFFIHPDHRGQGVAAALLAEAVELAGRRGAAAIEGFPLSGSKRRSSGSDLMTGVESLFESAGFAVDHRPSNNRVVMRRDL